MVVVLLMDLKPLKVSQAELRFFEMGLEVGQDLVGPGQDNVPLTLPWIRPHSGHQQAPWTGPHSKALTKIQDPVMDQPGESNLDQVNLEPEPLR